MNMPRTYDESDEDAMAGALKARGEQPRAEFKWTAEADAELRRLLAEGYSSGEIAPLLSRSLGIALTRNAVIGRAHRKGWFPKTKPRSDPRTESMRKYAAAARKRKWRARQHAAHERALTEPVSAAAPKPPVDLTPTIRFFDRTRSQCAWISGDPSFDAMCCGRPVIKGRPYCLAHCRIAYQRPGDYRRASLPPEGLAAPPATHVAA